MKWLVLMVLTVLFVSLTVASDGEVWEEDDHEVNIRNERGGAAGKSNKKNCRYTKGDWSECDTKTNMRTRTLTLKKGDQKTCDPTKMIQKKCRKACRYERGPWGDCTQNQMTRKDKLKPNSDPSCEQNRTITKKCNGSKPTKGKGKTPRRNRQ